jgi:aryl-alcohol dehydrogenase-like predicted oxidoreductase
VGLDRLTLANPVARIGLGLAAVGRPGYITIGRAGDLPADRSPQALRQRCHDLLDEAYAHGVRYFDVARSYGRAEEFLAEWVRRRGEAVDAVVGSKWGYTYTAGWRVDAEVHEVKDHGVATFDRQWAESRSMLGARLDLYQVHSVTPDSPALSDPALHERLARLADAGTTVGLSVTGPRQAEAIRTALGVTVGGRPLFTCVQATWNLLETSAGPALAEAHASGRRVIIKEALANGRLVVEELRQGTLALAAALHQPWVDVVLSGASTTAQLAANVAAATLRLDSRRLGELSELAEPAESYWQYRATLPWS